MEEYVSAFHNALRSMYPYSVGFACDGVAHEHAFLAFGREFGAKLFWDVHISISSKNAKMRDRGFRLVPNFIRSAPSESYLAVQFNV